MPQSLPTVRIADPDEEDDLMAMCRRLHVENGLFSFNDDKVREVIRRCPANGVVIGVIGEKHHLEASICLMVADFYYTDDLHLAELWNYVEPEFRRSRNAEALLRYGMTVAEKMEKPFFTGIITNKQMSGKVRQYRRLLGYPVGAFFVHNSKWVKEPMEDHNDLRDRLKDAAQQCNDFKINSATAARDRLGPLFREAAEALSAEDNLWGGASRVSDAA
jgi:hypothetical protein